MTYFVKFCKGIVIISVFQMVFACTGSKALVAKVDVKKISEVENGVDNSIVYFLPTTALRVQVSVEKKVSKVGPFYRYSQRFLNVAEVVTEDKEEWAVKNVKVYTVGVPDENRCFKIEAKGANSANMVNLTHEGILRGLNLPNYMETSSLTEAVEKRSLKLGDVNFDEVPLMEKVLLKTSTAAMAEEAANFIYKIRKRKFKIIACDYETLPKDGESYKLVVEELEKIEKQYVELFTGKVVSEVITQTFEFIPDSMSLGNTVLFRFSSQSGLLDRMDLSGTPVYIDVDVDRRKPLPVKRSVLEKDKKEVLSNGLFYCRPCKATVKVIDKNKLLLKKEVLLGQYGQVISLPSSMLEEEGVTVELEPTTGALQSVSK